MPRIGNRVLGMSKARLVGWVLASGCRITLPLRLVLGWRIHILLGLKILQLLGLRLLELLYLLILLLVLGRWRWRRPCLLLVYLLPVWIPSIIAPAAVAAVAVCIVLRCIRHLRASTKRSYNTPWHGNIQHHRTAPEKEISPKHLSIPTGQASILFSPTAARLSFRRLIKVPSSLKRGTRVTLRPYCSVCRDKPAK
ncbi:hypothetical protein K431DRAFT_129989 [Polychaeton citri CBS 116435]|uniref:Uncharacterized protein n=1 Tax=Polychaeton citri CBS 116435 TaxID=1314669 RepID=A0A9P4UK11_9PEZI|nr:hypothetical protein K431DRAFT_129989 [Polychaeton citri CBS 116435]